MNYGNYVMPNPPLNYVLIDFENVQPENLEILSNHPFKIIVFIGANQKSIPLKIASAMQSLKDARYIQISGNGKNALDFHITYYLGRLTLQDPKAHFYVISKDKGFDTLIDHLRSRKFHVFRHNDLAEIPILQIPSGTDRNEKISAIIKNLEGRGQSRPRKIQTLKNTIKSLFADDLSENELVKLIKALEKEHHIVLNQENVSYRLRSSEKTETSLVS